MILRRLKNSLLLLLAVLILLLASLSALVETQAGSRWLLRQLAQWLPLELGEVQGNLRAGLDVSHVAYRQGELYIRVEQASFRWRPVDLLYGALALQSLTAGRILIQLPPAAGQSPTAEQATEPFSAWPSLRLPLRIHVDQLALQQIEYRQGELALAWQELSGRALSLGTFHLRYSDLQLRHRDYALSLSGKTDLDFPYASDASLAWRIGAEPALAEAGDTEAGDAEGANTKPGAAFPYLGSGQLSGSLRDLQLALESRQPVVLRARAWGAWVNQQNQLVVAPQLQLEADWNQQQLPAAWWLPGQVPPVTSAKLSARGNWLGYSAHLAGDLQLPAESPLAAIPALDLTLAVEGDTRGLQINQLQVREQSPAAPLITPQEAAQSETAQSETIQPEDPPQQAPQQLALAGELQWLPRLQWQLDAKGEHLNLASLLADWPSYLDASLRSRGYLDYASGDWQLGLEQLDIHGSLRNLNLEASGQLQADPKAWRSQGLELLLGANRLQLKGGVSEQVYLEWDLRAPMLDQLGMGLAGSLATSGQLRGSPRLPQLALELKADGLAWQDYRVEQLQMAMTPLDGAIAPLASTGASGSSGSPDPAAPPAALGLPLDEQILRSARYRLEASGRRLYLGDQQLSSFSLQGEGALDQHQLGGKVKSPQWGSLELALAGRYSESGWRGRLQQASVKFKKVPRWWLVSAKPIALSKDAAAHRWNLQLGDQCFTTSTNLTAAVERNPLGALGRANPQVSPVETAPLLALPASPITKLPPPRLCLNGSWGQPPGQEAGLVLQALLDAVPLRQFYALFKPEVFFAGVMDGQLQVRSPSLRLDQLRAEAEISTRHAELRYQFPGGATEVYPWRQVSLAAGLNKGRLVTRAQMEWQDYGQLHASGDFDLLSGQIHSGGLHARFSNLAPLETLITPANNVSGDLRLDLSLAGQLAKPLVSGDLSLSNGSANIPKLGLDLQGIQLHLSADRSERINLVGQISSKDGQLSLDGQLNQLGSPQWQARANLRGGDFRVINTSQVKANISPELELTANAGELRLTGAANIPWARVALKALPPSTTRVSSDVVIVDQPQTAAQASGGPALYANINLSLGKDVRFKGFGLDSELGGALQLNKEAQRQLFTNGFVAVRKGTYKAYGQNLSIERGRLIFQGPYDNPGLDIRASRRIADDDNTQVGLEIGGTLQRPNAKVYSLPSRFSDSEAMMMLLSGKPLDDSSRAEASLLLGALGGLGNDSVGISQGIANFFRVDELAVNSDKGIDQSELWIGKQLTPKLMVRYMVGLFDRLASIGVEYQLSERLRLEAESGETQSVDVIYKIER